MLLRTMDLVSGYGQMPILQGVTMEMAAREIVTIVGPNGAGKSTFLKTVVGLVPPWEGTVEFRGDDITGTAPEDVIDHGIAYVPQNENVFTDLTVRENFRMGAWELSDDFKERLSAVGEIFPLLGERPDQRVRNMSGGQQQMVAIASALMIDPDLLILDEPSAGLAPSVVDDVFDAIAEINETGTSILMVEQNARRALEASDRGIVLAMGQNEVEGDGDELLDSEEVAELYLGE
jgi:branched-chain amino acid transport system ATP-binding protein